MKRYKIHITSKKKTEIDWNRLIINSLKILWWAYLCSSTYVCVSVQFSLQFKNEFNSILIGQSIRIVGGRCLFLWMYVIQYIQLCATIHRFFSAIEKNKRTKLHAFALKSLDWNVKIRVPSSKFIIWFFFELKITKNR